MNNYYICSFCGATELNAKKIIAKGRNDEAAICSECVVCCVGVLANTRSTERTKRTEMNNAASVEFWQLIKALSEMTISSLKVAQVMGGEDQTSHLAGLSRLQVLLSEQALADPNSLPDIR
ncbi:hypothetical protein HV178_06280 [Citrobacter freundii]|uniref:ClpX-type ZB domain-containing protein n=1 Tax=Citrobacter freundii TaxID=546 RepID=A0AAP9QAW0_CITFR|nr:hypothetical protein HV178_06280 [Citrobacter freundii]